MQGRIYNFFQGGGRSLPFLLSPSLPLHKFTCQTVTITSFSSPFHPPFLLPSAAPSFSLSSPFPSLFLTLSYPPYSPFSHPLNYLFLLSLPLHLRLFFSFTLLLPPPFRTPFSRQPFLMFFIPNNNPSWGGCRKR